MGKEKRRRRAAAAKAADGTNVKVTHATADPAPDIMDAIRDLTTTVNRRLDDFEQRLLDLEEWATAPERRPASRTASTRGPAPSPAPAARPTTPNPAPSAAPKQGIGKIYKYFNRITHRYEYAAYNYAGLCEAKRLSDPFHEEYQIVYAMYVNGSFHHELTDVEICRYRGL